VATFNLGQEALGHEEALLFNGGRKHHIVPLGNRRRLAYGRQVMWGGRRQTPQDRDSRQYVYQCERPEPCVREERPNHATDRR
jgi:hypothetical protein